MSGTKYLATIWLAFLAAGMAALWVALPARAMPHLYQVDVWYASWGTPGISAYESLSQNASVVNEVNPYWYALKPDGSIVPYAGDPRLLSLARRNRIRVMPLITNEFDPERVHRILSSRASRDAQATKLTRLVVEKGYAGIDLDYESLYASDRNRFSAFVEDLARRLHARGKKLSVDVHPKTSEPGAWSGAKAEDWRRLGRAADEFKIMTYDYHWDGSKAGPAAPPKWVNRVLAFAETQVAPRKIRMGLPFYGRDWVGTKSKDLVHTDVVGLMDTFSPAIRRGLSGEPYFHYPSGHTVYY